jgi:hypothetical protein
MKRKERRTVWCACGCKTAMETPDSEGRERRFISGHNAKKYKGKQASKWGANKRWAKGHPETIKAGKRTYHHRRKLQVITYLGGKCKHCGLKYNGTNASVFQFHHRKPWLKKFAVGNKVTQYTWLTLKKEADKCDLLCANCHHIHHGGKW